MAAAAAAVAAVAAPFVFIGSRGGRGGRFPAEFVFVAAQGPSTRLVGEMPVPAMAAVTLLRDTQEERS